MLIASWVGRLCNRCTRISLFFFSTKVHSLELEKQLVEDRNTLLIQQLDTLRRESESRMSMMEGTCDVCKLKMKVSLC